MKKPDQYGIIAIVAIIAIAAMFFGFVSYNNILGKAYDVTTREIADYSLDEFTHQNTLQNEPRFRIELQPQAIYGIATSAVIDPQAYAIGDEEGTLNKITFQARNYDGNNIQVRVRAADSVSELESQSWLPLQKTGSSSTYHSYQVPVRLKEYEYAQFAVTLSRNNTNESSPYFGRVQLQYLAGYEYDCGNSIIEFPEECDYGIENGVPCVPTYDNTCTYCSDTCEDIVVEGEYCGDSICQEQWENYNTCPEDCEPDSYCGDGECIYPEDEFSCYEDCHESPPGDGCPETKPTGMISCADFENVELGDIPQYDPTGDGEISEVTRTLYCNEGDVPPCDGAFINQNCMSGQCARAYTQATYIGGDSYSELKWRYDNMLSGNQVYYKFDMRIDPNLGTSNENREIYNFKFFSLTDYPDISGGAISNEWHPTINLQPSRNSYDFYQWSQGSCYGQYYFHRATTKQENHLMDNQWHTYEIFMNIGNAVVTDQYDENADGVVKIWEDEVLILEDYSVPFRCSTDEGQIIRSVTPTRHAKSQGAPVDGMAGNIYFDNLELWNMIPPGR